MPVNLYNADLNSLGGDRDLLGYRGVLTFIRTRIRAIGRRLDLGLQGAVVRRNAETRCGVREHFRRVATCGRRRKKRETARYRRSATQIGAQDSVQAVFPQTSLRLLPSESRSASIPGTRLPKLRNASDTLPGYMDHLRANLSITKGSSLIEGPQINEEIGKVSWVEATHFESELEGYYTTYLATTWDGFIYSCNLQWLIKAYFLNSASSFVRVFKVLN
jgi:hypothetical protein